MSKKGPDVAGALAAMRSAPAVGRGRKSEAYEWLHARHDVLAQAFAERPPSWKALAVYLGENGIKGGNGKPPTAAALRSAWLRVLGNVARRRSSQGKGEPLPRGARQAVTPSKPTPQAADEQEHFPDFDQPIRAR
jgi:hypothetical protein